MSRALLLLSLLLAFGVASADDAPDAADPDSPAVEEQEQAKPGPKLIDGMSVLGNREAPKALVIVPWKSSVIGDSIAISTMLDESRQPVDREVFLRELRYWEIRSEATP